MSINISVRAESRAAKAAKAYNDQVKHGYNPNYVNPKTRRINLSSGKLPPIPALGNIESPGVVMVVSLANQMKFLLRL